MRGGKGRGAGEEEEEEEEEESGGQAYPRTKLISLLHTAFCGSH